MADHKGFFFAANDATGEPISCHDAIAGGLRLVPDGPSFEVLRGDYDRMTDGGYLLDEAEPFDTIMAKCQAIADRANKAAA